MNTSQLQQTLYQISSLKSMQKKYLLQCRRDKREESSNILESGYFGVNKEEESVTVKEAVTGMAAASHRRVNKIIFC